MATCETHRRKTDPLVIARQRWRPSPRWWVQRPCCRNQIEDLDNSMYVCIYIYTHKGISNISSMSISIYLIYIYLILLLYLYIFIYTYIYICISSWCQSMLNLERQTCRFKPKWNSWPDTKCEVKQRIEGSHQPK